MRRFVWIVSLVLLAAVAIALSWGRDESPTVIAGDRVSGAEAIDREGASRNPVEASGASQERRQVPAVADRFEVTIVDALDRPVPLVARVWLGEGVSSQAIPGEAALEASTDREGVARFERVPLGSPRTVWYALDDELPIIPAAEPVAVDSGAASVRLAPFLSVVVGRLTSSAHPVRRCDVSVDSRHEIERVDVTATDEGGRFAVVFLVRPSRPLDIVLTAERHAGSAQIRFEPPVGGRLFDLGDVPLEPCPVALAGRVVDDSAAAPTGMVGSRFGRRDAPGS